MVGNKLDAAKYPDEAMSHYIKLLDQPATLGAKEVISFNQVRLSAQNDWNAVAGLLEEVMAVLPKNSFFFPGSGKSDQHKEVWAAELIREEAMKALYKELPYTVATRVTSWEQRQDGMHMIQAEIVVEKMQHRSMVIGKGGVMIKKIGQRTRKQLEIFLSGRVFLGLEVIVIPEWRSDQEALRELGYE